MSKFANKSNRGIKITRTHIKGCYNKTEKNVIEKLCDFISRMNVNAS